MSDPRDPTFPEEPITTLEDTSLVAYLKLKGHTLIPWISREDPSDTRVSFDIQGDRAAIAADMQRFFDNELIGIQDFCRNLKEVKSAMYNMKRIGQGKK
jgi:hypothetical protein